MTKARHSEEWYHCRAIEALRRDGATIIEAGDDRFCELRSTLKALRLQRRGEVKRRLNERLPRYVLVLHDHQSGAFVLQDQLSTLTDGMDEAEAERVRIAMDGNDLRLFVRWRELAPLLLVFSAHPAAVEWTAWFCGEFLPALSHHGYCNPATHHEPPPSRLLDAMEIREQGRDLLNAIAPGLGDALAREGRDEHRTLAVAEGRRGRDSPWRLRRDGGAPGLEHVCGGMGGAVQGSPRLLVGREAVAGERARALAHDRPEQCAHQHRDRGTVRRHEGR
jgi:hypothetical protein